MSCKLPPYFEGKHVAREHNINTVSKGYTTAAAEHLLLYLLAIAEFALDKTSFFFAPWAQNIACTSNVILGSAYDTTAKT